MTNYRRVTIEGASYFFTVNIANRNSKLLTDNIELLRRAFLRVKTRHPFHIDAIVILPDHLHCIWTLPENDTDYAARWSLIKSCFSRGIPHGEPRSNSRKKRGERGLWQRRYWEHLIRDEADRLEHINYIHWNPVKHEWAQRTRDWPYSSFHQYVKKGILDEDWGDNVDCDLNAGERNNV